jgi:AraC-like DNA-binding protein
VGEEDGLEFLSEFRQKSSVPVLLITGFGSEAVAARALELRANGYLRKPFDLNELRVKVDGLLAEGPRAEHLAERARAVIDRIATESVTVLELAERMGVKPAHLQGAFRDRYGKTPMQYLRAVRLQQAQALLLTTKIPVSEVAVMVGFREITYFDRSFKRQYGVTPLEYRRTRALPESR